jgi:hypothetical protein
MIRVARAPLVAVALTFASACSGDLSGPPAQDIGGTPAFSHAANPVVVTISGELVSPVTGNRLQVRAQVDGPAAALTGMGSDAGKSEAAPFYCRFSLTGTLVGNVVTLAGTVTFSTADVVGVPVTITATDVNAPNPSNDPITFTFGPFVFVGTGSVVIAHQ